MKTLFLRELKQSFRYRGGFGLPIVFFLAVALLLPLGVGPDPETHRKMSTGVLWAGALLANLVSLQQLFQEDVEDGTLERLLVSPLPLEAFAAFKFLASWLATGVPLCLAAPVLGIMLNLPPGSGLAVTLTLLIGTPALSAIGALGSAFAAGTGRGAMLAAVLVVPFCIPTMIFGSLAVEFLADGRDAATPLAALAAISLASVALIPIASARLLRITLR